MAGYKVGNSSLSQFIDQLRADIISAEGWRHRDESIIASIKKIAPEIPLSVIRKTYIRKKKTWLPVDEELFSKNFIVEK
jgi:ABC-type Fe3+-citrate transport system substrate-binding protein